MSTDFVGLNTDRREALALALNELPWIPSPGGEVTRRMLERAQAETGLATSVVRYPAGSRFPQHTHGGGEEFLVLEGVFEDEHGQYPPGSYVRNPIGSSHSPGSKPGCVIFVKLWQMTPEQSRRVVLSADDAVWTDDTDDTGAQRLVLYEDGLETVSMTRCANDVDRDLSGHEVLVVRGAVTWGDRSWAANSWLRLAPSKQTTITLEAGTTLWTKHGHLPA